MFSKLKAHKRIDEKFEMLKNYNLTFNAYLFSFLESSILAC